MLNYGVQCGFVFSIYIYIYHCVSLIIVFCVYVFDQYDNVNVITSKTEPDQTQRSQNAL